MTRAPRSLAKQTMRSVPPRKEDVSRQATADGAEEVARTGWWRHSGRNYARDPGRDRKYCAAKLGSDAVLADYFDYVAGTSTGAIIAACLSVGMSVDDVRQFYVTSGPDVQ